MLIAATLPLSPLNDKQSLGLVVLEVVKNLY